MPLLWIVLVLLPGIAMAQPAVDHHQHLFSPALVEVIKGTPITAAELVQHLDDAGIKRAVVLSTAYSFSNPARKVQKDYAFVRADNDWTAEQVARYPDRLVGFCGLNPLKDYALEELARCAKNPNLARGLKLHFGNSFVEYHNPRHIEQMKRVFRGQRLRHGDRRAHARQHQLEDGRRRSQAVPRSTPSNFPRMTWAAFRKLPLTEAEFHTIESNVAPYMR